jgi:hypothetical protein
LKVERVVKKPAEVSPPRKEVPRTLDLILDEQETEKLAAKGINLM